MQNVKTERVDVKMEGLLTLLSLSMVMAFAYVFVLQALVICGRLIWRTVLF